MTDKKETTADKIRAHMEKIRKSLGAIDTHLEDGKRSLDSIGKPNSLKEAKAENIHKVDCPKCGAKAGERCTYPSGVWKGQRMTSWHNERAQEANKKDIKEESFGSAFKAARAGGKETFEFGGKSYTTQKAGESSSQWKNNLKPATTTAPVPLSRPRPKFEPRVAGKPDAPVGSMPAKRPDPVVRSRPDAPTGSLPKSKFEPVVKTRPDSPVGSMPVKKPVVGLRLPSDPVDSYVKRPPSSFSSSAKSAADTLADRMRRTASINKVDVVGNMGKPPVVSGGFKDVVAAKAKSMSRVKVGIRETIIDRYRNKKD